MTRNPGVNAERLQRVLYAQFGVISRQQALACGLSLKAIQHRLRPDGPWQRLLPGIYLTVTGLVAQEHREMAARLHGGPTSLITGPTAVRRHHMTCPGPATIDVLVPWTCRRGSMAFVRLHRTRHFPERCFYTRQLAFAPKARAVADAARLLATLDDVRAVVSGALQCNACTLEELAAELHAGGMPYSRLFRAALAEASAGTRSVPEAKFRRLLVSSELPEPVFNAQLFDARGQFIAILDAWWPEAGVGAEIDSNEYHLKAADQQATNRRHDRIVAQGILLLHFPPSRLNTDGSGILRELGSAIANGMRRSPLPILTVPLAA